MSLARFEKLAERLVEGSLARLFVGQLHPREIAVQLVRAMEDAADAHKPSGELPADEDARGRFIAPLPHQYNVLLHPDDYADIAAHRSEIETALAEQVLELARQAGFVLGGTPSVALLPDQATPRLSAIVQVNPADADTRFHTQAFDRQELPPEPSPRPAWLIIGGRRSLPLTRPLITIGRRLDNDIILDDPRVSRQHAQLRYRYGHYVLYDLGSKGGSSVNGVPCKECLLQSGDVISLAGIELIYIEDEDPAGRLPAGEDTIQAAPVSRPSPDVDTPG